MRHRAKGRQLSRTSTHKRAMLNNMATSLFVHGRVITTEAKAKAVSYTHLTLPTTERV